MLTHMEPVLITRIKAVSGIWLWVLGQCKYVKAVVTKASVRGIRILKLHVLIVLLLPGLESLL